MTRNVLKEIIFTFLVLHKISICRKLFFDLKNHKINNKIRLRKYIIFYLNIILSCVYCCRFRTRGTQFMVVPLELYYCAFFTL